MQLSPSKINVLNNCPRCFFMEDMKIKRPRGIFPSIPGGIDLVLKTYYDEFRTANKLPPETKTQLSGEELYPDIAILKKWRHWRTGLTCVVEGVKLIGALDDALLNKKGQISPYDYKTKGSEPKDDGSQYYQTQLDIYELMLSENGFQTSGYGYLAYYYPEKVTINGIKFGTKIYKIKTSIDNAIDKIKLAKEILEGTIPDADPKCQYCTYENQKIGNGIV